MQKVNLLPPLFGFFPYVCCKRGKIQKAAQSKGSSGVMFSLGQCCKSVMPSKYLLSRVTIFESENERLYAACSFDEYTQNSI